MPAWTLARCTSCALRGYARFFDQNYFPIALSIHTGTCTTCFAMSTCSIAVFWATSMLSAISCCPFVGLMWPSRVRPLHCVFFRNCRRCQQRQKAFDKISLACREIKCRKYRLLNPYSYWYISRTRIFQFAAFTNLLERIWAYIYSFQIFGT